MMIARKDLEFMRFVTALNALEIGHHTGHFKGRRYGVTIERPVDARVTKLFARALGGSDIVSFNLFQVADSPPVLKPCEMASEKMIDFVLQFEPDHQYTANLPCDVVAT
jgi:hypothetical protein